MFPGDNLKFQSSEIAINASKSTNSIEIFNYYKNNKKI